MTIELRSLRPPGGPRSRLVAEAGSHYIGAMKCKVRLIACFLLLNCVGLLNGWAGEPAPFGTLTADKLATAMRYLEARRTYDPAHAHRFIVELLVADRAIGPWNRQRPRLVTLAKAGRLHGLRIIWFEGSDELTVTPFDERIASSGQPSSGIAILDTRKWTGERLEARIRSKDLGQGWAFDLDISTSVPIAGGFEPEPTPVSVTPAMPATHQ